MAGDSISREFICHKALKIYQDLTKDTPGTRSASEEDFKASRGWFSKFRKSAGLHNVIRHGEASSANKAEAEKFSIEFSKKMADKGYLPQQIFNGDETGLFWKKMPNRTYISKEEATLPGHKPMKDRYTVLLCANASGDCKIKPLLVYHSETPRAFKKHGVVKSRLGVLWKSNQKAWVTKFNFKEWVLEVFAPNVKKFLQERSLPLKAVLLLDNAPGHPQEMEELEEEFDFIKVVFLPPNTNSLIRLSLPTSRGCMPKHSSPGALKSAMIPPGTSGKTTLTSSIPSDLWKKLALM